MEIQNFLRLINHLEILFKRLLEVIVNGVVACSHCMGLVMGEGMGNDGFLYYTIYCTHYTRTGTGTGNHCFLLCPILVPVPVPCSVYEPSHGDVPLVQLLKYRNYFVVQLR